MPRYVHDYFPTTPNGTEGQFLHFNYTNFFTNVYYSDSVSTGSENISTIDPIPSYSVVNNNHDLISVMNLGVYKGDDRNTLLWTPPAGWYPYLNPGALLQKQAPSSSYDAKMERLYVMTKTNTGAEASGSGATSVWHSSNNGVTWDQRATTPMGEAFPRGVFTSRILAYNTDEATNYTTSYCIQAVAGHYLGSEEEVINTVYVSSNDGANFWSSGSQPFSIFAIMDMDL